MASVRQCSSSAWRRQNRHPYRLRDSWRYAGWAGGVDHSRGVSHGRFDPGYAFGNSRFTTLAGLSSRIPLNDGCRTLRSRVPRFGRPLVSSRYPPMTNSWRLTHFTLTQPPPATRPVGRIRPLRDNAFQVALAGELEELNPWSGLRWPCCRDKRRADATDGGSSGSAT